METSEIIGLFDKYILIIVKHLVDKQDCCWNTKLCWKVFQVVGPELILNKVEELWWEKAILDLKYKKIVL